MHASYLERNYLGYFLGRGNNAALIEQLMEKRGWWRQLTKTCRTNRSAQGQWTRGELDMDPDDQTHLIPGQTRRVRVPSAAHQPLQEPPRNIEQAASVCEHAQDVHGVRTRCVQLHPDDLHFQRRFARIRQGRRPLFPLLQGTRAVQLPAPQEGRNGGQNVQALLPQVSHQRADGFGADDLPKQADHARAESTADQVALHPQKNEELLQKRESPGAAAQALGTGHQAERFGDARPEPDSDCPRRAVRGGRWQEMGGFVLSPEFLF